jgi:hypothetical protein
MAKSATKKQRQTGREKLEKALNSSKSSTSPTEENKKENTPDNSPETPATNSEALTSLPEANIDPSVAQNTDLDNNQTKEEETASEASEETEEEKTSDTTPEDNDDDNEAPSLSDDDNTPLTEAISSLTNKPTKIVKPSYDKMIIAMKEFLTRDRVFKNFRLKITCIKPNHHIIYQGNLRHPWAVLKPDNQSSFTYTSLLRAIQALKIDHPLCLFFHNYPLTGERPKC